MIVLCHRMVVCVLLKSSKKEPLPKRGKVR
jgi:hypothetical protein